MLTKNTDSQPPLDDAHPKGESLLEAIRAYRRMENAYFRLEAGLDLATALEEAGKAHLSQRILRTLTRQFPNDYRPYLRLASAEVKRQNFIGSWSHLQTCLHINPDCNKAWEIAYICATNLEKHDICEEIANKLLRLSPDSAKYYEMLGHCLVRQHRPHEACSAYNRAYELSPEDIVYFLNSRFPFCRIPSGGITPHLTASKILSTTSEIRQRLKPGHVWVLRSDHGLTNSLFYTAYSPLNLKRIYEPYLSLLCEILEPVIRSAVEESTEMAAHSPFTVPPKPTRGSTSDDKKNARIRLGMASRQFSSHSNTQAFEGFVRYLDRQRFTLVLIHIHETITDAAHMKLNEWADEVVYLAESPAHTHWTLSSLDLDLLFFTDIGMSPFDFLIPALRACNIQLTGWGLPHTTGLNCIDYYLSSNLLENKEHADEYTESLVLLKGLPCCFLSESLNYQKKPKHYFMLPDDRVVIGCVQSLIKIHADMDLILEQIAKRLPDVIFAFATFTESLDTAFLTRLAKRAPIAYQRTVMLERCATNDFLALCDCCDILLDTPYYGAGVTAYMSTYVGTPMVCFSGSRLRDSTTAAIYRYLSITNAPIVNSIPEYVEKVVELAQNFDLRFQIKKDTVDAAHRLYDNQEYIRSFEEFCLNLLGRT